VTASIELEGVGKRYWQLSEQAMLLKSLMPFSKPARTERWAVDGITTAIEAGETVGVLGRNGAGKTSLLRLLAGVSRPTTGRIRIRGRVAPLISVGVGFHQEMSGRENVYVNGMLLGLTRREVTERFDQIVDFAELEDYIDTPVKFYSSGMYMRLGFSVAAHVDPDVLLVDEVLAVGDLAFQLKCIQHMGELQRRGTTIVIVSHSMHAIRLLCPRALLIRRGRLEFDGDTETAISRHHELLSMDAADRRGGDEGGGSGVTVVSRELVGPHGPTNHPDQEDLLVYLVKVRFDRRVESPHFAFQVITEVGTLAYGMQTTIGKPWQVFEAGETAEVEVVFRPRLGGGTYRLTLVVTDLKGADVLHQDPNGLMMYIAPKLGTTGFADLEATIAVGELDMTSHQSVMLGNGTPGNGADLPNSRVLDQG
jgi:lipopolysaccharide transport system ATP-binding protein